MHVNRTKHIGTDCVISDDTGVDPKIISIGKGAGNKSKAQK